MMTATQQEKTYDWSESDARVRELGFKNFKAWALEHGFSHKTAYLLRQGRIAWGFGPKVRAIVDQALKDGVVRIV